MTAEEVLEIARGYQASCVLLAAAELDIYSLLMVGPLTAEEVACRISGDQRASEVLLDALSALGILVKERDLYSLPADLVPILGSHGPGSILAMVQHQANCLRRWSRLAWVVRSGKCCPREPSVRGESADQAAFIGAMDNLAAPIADGVIRALDDFDLHHLLDVGGASGSWTVAFLRRHPFARATLFDLPYAMPIAEQRLTEAGIRGRARLVEGDFYVDPLPGGADIAWVSAIVHQNSREQNRHLFAKVHAALLPEGRIAIRDIVMEPSRTRPVSGALFAVNMLVATEGGCTFTFEELRQDLEAAGFRDVTVARSDPGMNSIIVARRCEEL